MRPAAAAALCWPPVGRCSRCSAAQTGPPAPLSCPSLPHCSALCCMQRVIRSCMARIHLACAAETAAPTWLHVVPLVLPDELTESVDVPGLCIAPDHAGSSCGQKPHLCTATWPQRGPHHFNSCQAEVTLLGQRSEYLSGPQLLDPLLCAMMRVGTADVTKDTGKKQVL